MQPSINFSDVLDAKQLTVLGYTTDFNKCDCCGRENLKGTVAILSCDTVMHFGTTCAASADKYDTLEAAKLVKKEVTKAVNKYKDVENAALLQSWKLLAGVFGATNGTVNCSKACFQTLAAEILKLKLEGNNKVVLLEGQPIPVQFRADLETAGLCVRLAIPLN